MELLLRFIWWAISAFGWFVSVVMYYSVLMVGLDWYYFNASRIVRQYGYSQIVYEVVAIPLFLLLGIAVPIYLTAMWVIQSSKMKTKVFHE